MGAVTQDKISFLHSLIQESDRIVIVSHNHPDGDAAGSSTALMHFIRNTLGRSAEVILPSPLPDSLGFLCDSGVSTACDDPARADLAIASADLIICLDLNTFSRTDILECALASSRAPKVLIDHHLHPDLDKFILAFSETEVSSTCELLYGILLEMPEIAGAASRLPVESATALMTGMTTDTNNFANSVFPGTLRMASELLAAGVDRDFILDKVFNSYRENRLRAMGWMLDSNMTITEHGIAYMILKASDLERFDLREGETESFVNLPLAVETVKMTILLKEDKAGYFRVSVRSKKGVSANRLAGMHFHGGGHEQAAGGRLYWPDDIASPDEAAQYIEQVTARYMQNQTPSE